MNYLTTVLPCCPSCVSRILLFQGLHFSPLDTLVTVLWNEFAAEVPEGSARSVAL